MRSITFIDIEVDPESGKILDIGGIQNNGSSFHSNSSNEFINFLKGTQFICGHNILSHDLKYLERELIEAAIDLDNAIDTLFLSPLLFPKRPYHALIKDDKLLPEDRNNPLNDSKKARDLFNAEVNAFEQLDVELKQIFCSLLKKEKEFRGFFKYVDFNMSEEDVESIVRQKFQSEICESANLKRIISRHPIELTYCLALIHVKDQHSITPKWVLKNYPEVERIMFLLRSNPCITGCKYCNDKLDINRALKRYFGFDSFRKYDDEPLQENAVRAAVNNKSILAIFPTGGGKSITFQVPALLSGDTEKGLTVVISPLQSLMKDQIDNLEANGITSAVTVNGLLDPIERAKSLERVAEGSAHVLYISPESLRSKTIESLILARKIARFVIDEAHCFSAWGHDFRVDYLYIGDFIKCIQELKNLEENIPVSCFTATAKQKVIDDICDYFREKLSLELEVFRSDAGRTNLQYQVIRKDGDEEKYEAIRDLISQKECPTIIYVSRTRRAYYLAERLNKDGYLARPYHGKMDVREKTANQTAFMDGEIPIMVATSAFGMGVDKKDVGLVIHFDISDSLENYIQEAGRAGRDESISADCFVLFSDEDLGKHFILLNQTKLNVREIQQVWKAIKSETNQFRARMSSSALEIARKAGWDDNVMGMETRVTTAIAALEEAGYLKRGQNSPRIYANSILVKNAQEAIDKINASKKFAEKQKVTAIRIIKKLLSSKSRKQANEEEAESRVDYISDHLGIVKEEVISIINLLREEKILDNTKDLTAFIKKGESQNRSLNIVNTFGKIENLLLPLINEQEQTFNIKELNEKGETEGCEDINPVKIKTIFNFWSIKNWIKRSNKQGNKNHFFAVLAQPAHKLAEKQKSRHQLAKFIVEYLFEKCNQEINEVDATKEEILVEFSILELKEAFENRPSLFMSKISTNDVEDSLFYLSRIDAIKIEGGFLVIHNRLTIERIELDNKRRYKKEDHQKLDEFYTNKIQQIHIVGEYAQKMIEDYKSALQFVDDYFRLNYSSFLQKYFKGSRQDEIKRNITPSKFRQLFGELSPSQLEIIKNNQSKYIVVAAGPGSGKTRVLVHKLASLLLIEDVKHEQLLMLTFSRAAATEFKKRLIGLVGNVAQYVDVKTFHSYCFDILGRVGSLEKSGEIIKEAIQKIKSKQIEVKEVTRTALVIDEAQDIDADEYKLLEALMEQNEDMRVIAVGDDDQNIFEFRGASSKYLMDFIETKKAKKYELIENYRCKNNLVEFANQFVQSISNRLKENRIRSYQADNGKIKLVHYKSNNLINPLVPDILNTELKGSTCVLTTKNQEALYISSNLSKKRIPTRLIQTNDGFSLFNLQEIRFLLDWLNSAGSSFTISEETWLSAQKELKDKFRRSNKLSLCMNLVKSFEGVNPKIKYKSDLEIFIRESRIEDFYGENVDTINVSTIHKAKGMEFDNVFLLLENLDVRTDQIKRQLYVAITRAKQNLTIHTNGNYFDQIKTDNLNRIDDENIYPSLNEIFFQLTLKDVKLGYFEFVQHRIKVLQCGDELALTDEGCANKNGEEVLKFSKKFAGTIAEYGNKGLNPRHAKVNYLIYWCGEESNKEVLTVLPEILFERTFND